MKETHTSITFVCGVELYVCVCLVYVFVDEGVCLFVCLVSYMFKMSSDIFCIEYDVFCVKKLFDVYVRQVL